MNEALEVCQQIADYSEGSIFSQELEKLFGKARQVIANAMESGELARQLKVGDQLDTGMLFCGHKVILEIIDHWPSSFGACYSESSLRKRFQAIMARFDEQFTVSSPSHYSAPCPLE